MGIYETIAAAYDELFPPSDAARGFIGPPPRLSAGPVRGGPVRRSPGLPMAVDIGCATGAHAVMLAGLGWPTLGVDPSPAMVARAEKNASRAPTDPGRRGSLAFKEGGMLDLASLAPLGSAGIVLCVGNTLPHLRDAAELRSFLTMAADSIHPGGRLVVQLLNYRRILRERPAGLPELRAGSIRFRRTYRYRDDGRLDFITRLEDGAASYQDETTLTPFLPATVLAAAEERGLSLTGAYAGWDRSAFDEEASPVALLDFKRS